MSTLNDQIAQLQLLMNNALAILTAFNETNFSDVAFAEIAIDNGDGTNTVFNLPSNINNDRKIKALQNTVDALTSLSDSGQTLTVSIADPNVRILYIGSFERAFSELLSTDYVVSTTLSIKQNHLLEALTDPICRVQVTLPPQFSHIQHVRLSKFVITGSDKNDKFDTLNVTTTSTRSAVLQALNDTATTYKEFDSVFTLDAQKVRFYGAFSVLNIANETNGDFTCRLDKNTYNDSISTVINSKQLTVGDVLVTANGDSIWDVINITLINGVFVTLRKKGGFKAITSGIQTLRFHDQNDITKTVSIPIEGGERSFAFFAPIKPDTGIAGEWSQNIPISSANYSVDVSGITVPFDEYYNTNVLPIGQFILSQVSDQSVSRAVALDIAKPTLKTENFSVVQINAHLSRTGEFEKIKRLQEVKNNTSTKLASLSNEISEIRNRLARSTYRSSTAKIQDETILGSKESARNLQSKKLQTTIKEISSVSSTTSANKVQPIYHVRGFFKIDEPVSNDGQTQRLVSYEVRYKYVPSNSRASISQSLSSIDGVDGTKSPWFDAPPIVLEKEFNSDTEKYEWEQNDIANAQKNNINQVDIPLTYGEAVIIQVRAVSEAGYPSNPAKSLFSDDLRIEFPTSLAQNETISAIVSQNAEDEQIVKLDEFLRDKGYDKLTAESYETTEQYFVTKANTIDSTFKNDAGLVQNLRDFLTTLVNRVGTLEETVLRQSVSWSIEIIDSNGKSYPIGNRSSLKLFAGYYTESVDVTDVANYGDFIQEQFLLKITNNSASAGDILTLSAGDITARTTDINYTTAPFQAVTTPLQFQKNGQIFYLRTNSLSGADTFYTNDTTISTNTVTPSDIDTGALTAQKNVVSWDGVAASLIKLLDGATSPSYVALLKTHPIYAAYLTNPSPANLALLADEFARITNYTQILRDGFKQRDYDSLVNPQFLSDDKYLVGGNSCGSMLFTRPQQQDSVQVSTADASSPRTVEGGKSIQIPIIFQYRMTDGIGRLNGDGSKSLAASNLTYKKRIGFDIYLGSQIQFDIEVEASFRPTLQSSRRSVDNTPIITTTNGDATTL